MAQSKLDRRLCRIRIFSIIQKVERRERKQLANDEKDLFAEEFMQLAYEIKQKLHIYTEDEKKIIFTKFALPKILKRMSMKEEECVILPEALDEVVRRYSDTTGIRDLEQAAEHIAANALYQIEVNHVDKVVFDGKMVRELLG